MSKLYGLIGFPLTHSWSAGFFSEKFHREQIQNTFYELFPLESIEQFPGLIHHHKNLLGLNVTIPYKEKVIPYLDQLHESAEKVGAVNTIKIIREGRHIHTCGYNTDVFGFEKGLDINHVVLPQRALVLGTGGAARAVEWVLQKYDCEYSIVSRSKSQPHYITYQELKQLALADFPLIINTTPVGMFPHVDHKPDIAYGQLGPQNILYDLIYNPPLTGFLAQGKDRGCKVINGLSMLQGQAEKAWEIWNA